MTARTHDQALVAVRNVDGRIEVVRPQAGLEEDAVAVVCRQPQLSPNLLQDESLQQRDR